VSNKRDSDERMSDNRQPPIDVAELRRLLRLSDMPDHAIAESGEVLPVNWDETLIDALPALLDVVEAAREIDAGHFTPGTAADIEAWKNLHAALSRFRNEGASDE
jgi:hypothetical protein